MSDENNPGTEAEAMEDFEQLALVDAQGRRRTPHKTSGRVRYENRARTRRARANETPEQAEERKRRNRERMRARRAREAKS